MQKRTCLVCEQPLDGLTYKHKYHAECRAHRRREPQTRTRVCKGCATTFTYPVARGSDRSFCSEECQYRDYRRRAVNAKPAAECEVSECARRVRSTFAKLCEMHYGRMRRNGHLDRVKPAPDGKCRQCQRDAPQGRLYCSQLCRTRARIGVEHEIRGCLMCDTPMAQEDPLGRRYCGGNCQRQAARARSYGLSIAEYRAIRDAHGGQCAICRSTDRLVIDHDHDRGSVRGLLCGPCNVGIGMFGDDPRRLAAAIAYLDGARGKWPVAG